MSNKLQMSNQKETEDLKKLIGSRVYSTLWTYFWYKRGDTEELLSYTENELKEEILTGKISLDDLRKTRGCGEKTFNEIILWLGGQPPPPKTKRKIKTFRCFGKQIRITISITNN